MPTFFSIICLSAFTLIVCSFVAIGVLIAIRMRREHFDHDLPERRARLSKTILRFAMTGDPEASPRLADIQHDRDLLIEVAMDAEMLLRDDARVRVVALLRDLNIPDHLRSRARHGRVNERVTALEALRLFPDEATLATLAGAERSRSTRVRIASLRTSARIGRGPSMVQLLSLVSSTDLFRSPALGEMMEQRAREHFYEAISALREVREIPAKVMVLRAIGETNNLAATRVLREHVADENAEIRAAALGALGALGAVAAAPLFEAGLSDPDWRVRLKAVDAIGRLGLGGLRDYVEARLTDDLWWVRLRAQEALIKLDNPGAFSGSGRREGPPSSLLQVMSR